MFTSGVRTAGRRDKPDAPKVQIRAQLKVFDRKTKRAEVDSGGVDATRYLRAGNPVVPLGLRLPLNTLTPGGYRLELLVIDSAGKNATRSTEFDVQ